MVVAALDIRPEGGIPWWGWVVLNYPVVGTVFFARSTRAKVLAAERLEVAATRFLAGSFVVLGLACAPALFGHSLVYIGGGTPAAVVGTALSAILLVSTAPTRARLARFETELADRGRPSGIVARLMRPQPPDPS